MAAGRERMTSAAHFFVPPENAYFPGDGANGQDVGVFCPTCLALSHLWL